MATWKYENKEGQLVTATGNEVKPFDQLNFRVVGTSVGSSDFFWFAAPRYLTHVLSDFTIDSGTVQPEFSRDEAATVFGVILTTTLAAQKVYHAQTVPLLLPTRKLFVFPTPTTGTAVTIFLSFRPGLAEVGL